MVKLIVLDQMISSMTEFKQIIGRGTRIREKEGKMHFVVMDFRNVTRLFSDPEWDGPVEINEGFKHDEPLSKLKEDPVPYDPVTPVEPGVPRVKPIIENMQVESQLNKETDSSIISENCRKQKAL